MSRTQWKGNYLDSNILKNNKKSIKIWSRNSVIPMSLVNKAVQVYNGKEFKKVIITREKIGFKFGEFSFTRKHKAKNPK
jgi:small subunit ribosomal protein S19